MKFFALFLILLSSILIGGCRTHVVSTDGLKGELSTINHAADDIDSITNNEPKVKDKTDIIRTSTKVLDGGLSDLVISKDEEIKDLQSHVDALDRKLIEEKSKSNALLKKMIAGLIAAGTVGLGICTALFFLGNFRALTFGVISMGVIISGLTVFAAINYAIHIAIVVSALFALGILYYAFIYKKATKEIVKSVEKGIDNGAINKKSFADIANNIQQKSTKKIVDLNQNKKTK